ncbi:hypothetical protein SLA2020_153810 [Shorea laevis]
MEGGAGADYEETKTDGDVPETERRRGSRKFRIHRACCSEVNGVFRSVVVESFLSFVSLMRSRVCHVNKSEQFMTWAYNFGLCFCLGIGLN